MRTFLYLLLAVTISLALFSCKKDSGLDRKARPLENMPAPDITLNALGGGPELKLSTLKGNVVLLNFWATWCPPCREEIPSMIRLDKIMAGKPYRMICVAIDEGGKPAVESFLKSNRFDLPTYFDATGNASKMYGITGVPETFIIDKSGTIVKKIIGPIDWNSSEAVSFIEGLVKQ